MFDNKQQTINQNISNNSNCFIFQTGVDDSNTFESEALINKLKRLNGDGKLLNKLVKEQISVYEEKIYANDYSTALSFCNALFSFNTTGIDQVNLDIFHWLQFVSAFYTNNIVVSDAAYENLCESDKQLAKLLLQIKSNPKTEINITAINQNHVFDITILRVWFDAQEYNNIIKIKECFNAQYFQGENNTRCLRANIYYLIGLTCFNCQMFEEAIAYLSEAYELDASDRKFYFCNIAKITSIAYWKNCKNVSQIEDKSLDKKCLLLLLKNNNVKVAIDWADYHDYDYECYTGLLECIIRNIYKIEPYHIHNIFKKLYKSMPWEKLPRYEIAQLELRFVKAFDENHKPLCLYEQFNNNPQYVVELLYYAYFKDGETKNDNFLDDRAAVLVDLACHTLHYLKFCPCVNNGIIDAQKLNSWVDKYIQEITAAERVHVGYAYLGQFLARGPKNEDGTWPNYAICEVLEKLHNKVLDNNFIITKENDRGVYLVNNGEGERVLAKEFRDHANRFRHKYPYVATHILESLAYNYECRALIERQRAEHV